MHVRSRAPAFSVWLASFLTGIPWVATYHGIYKAKSPLKRWYNAVMTRGRLTIANSAFTRDHLLKEHRRRPRARRDHQPRRRSRPLRRRPRSRRRASMRCASPGAWPRTTARVKILLAGRLTRIKGQLPLVQAAARLAAAGPARLPDPAGRRRPGPLGLPRRGRGRGAFGWPGGRGEGVGPLRRHARRLSGGRHHRRPLGGAGELRAHRRGASGHGPAGDRVGPRRHDRDGASRARPAGAPRRATWRPGPGRWRRRWTPGRGAAPPWARRDRRACAGSTRPGP